MVENGSHWFPGCPVTERTVPIGLLDWYGLHLAEIRRERRLSSYKGNFVLCKTYSGARASKGHAGEQRCSGQEEQMCCSQGEQGYPRHWRRGPDNGERRFPSQGESGSPDKERGSVPAVK